jgi:hypothetical protein
MYTKCVKKGTASNYVMLEEAGHLQQQASGILNE